MATLEWENLTYSITDRKNQVRPILRGIAGSLRPNELTCIIGASGAGKTSLLNILSGRIASTAKNPFKGNITLDGQGIAPVAERELFAYVMQEDALFPTSTPRESIMMAAKLRKVPKPEEAVETVLTSLGLQKCADTLCGSHMIRGISGGEKKRTSIAVEIVSNPKLLFLDEPTSGLDSFAAYKCIDTLKELAQQGRTVALTIHQPSSEIFFLFDKVIFLCAGNVLYEGPVADVAKHFAAAGYPNPANYNICDYVTFLMQTLPEEDLANMRRTLWKGLHGKEEDAEGTGDIVIDGSETASQVVPTSDAEPIATATSELTATPFEEAQKKKAKYKLTRKSSFALQVSLLLRREVLDVFRDRASLIARIVLTTFLNLLYALIFFNSGDINSLNEKGEPNYSTKDHFGALTMISIGTMFGSAQPELLKFPLARPVFIREYASGLYRSDSYFMSKSLVELPVLFMQAAIIYLVTYWLVDLQGNWIFLVLSAWLLTLCASSCALLIGCLVPDIKNAMELAPLILVPQILFAGFFIPIDSIPVPLKYAQYLCFLKYGLNLILLIEFDIDRVENDLNNATIFPSINASYVAVLDDNRVDKDDWWIYLLVLLGMLVAFRLIALFALTSKGKNAVY